MDFDTVIQWRTMENNCADFLFTARKVRNVQKGLIYVSVFCVQGIVARLQEKYGVHEELPKKDYERLIFDSLLLHHSALGTMHVQKKTLQTMEQLLCTRAEQYVRRQAGIDV